MNNGRIDLIRLQRVVPLEISEIKLEYNKFHLSITGAGPEEETAFESLVKLENARMHLNFTRMLIRNLLDPSHNEYIANCKTEYEHMNGNIGRSDKRIDAMEQELRQIKNSVDKNPSNVFYILDYQRLLSEQMNGFVIQVLREAYKEFSENEFLNKDGTKIEKNAKFFIYLMFRQLYLSSETLGSLTREEKMTFSKKGIAVSDKAPPQIPKDADVVEENESDSDESDLEVEQMIESEPGEEDD